MAKHAAHAKEKPKAENFTTYLRHNLRTFLCFQAGYKFIGAVILPAIFYNLFLGAVHFSGFEYLAQNNLFAFMRHPYCWIAIILSLIAAGVYAMIDISATIFLCECGRQRRKVGLVPVIKFAVKNSCRAAIPKNWLIILMVLVVIPFLNLGVTPAFIRSLTIPDFIMEFIMYHWYLVILVALLFAGMFVLMVRWLYAFTFFTLEDDLSFAQACKRSVELGRGHRIRDFIALLITELKVVIVTILIAMVGIVVVFILAYPAFTFSGVEKALSYAGIGVISTFIILLVASVSLLSMSVCYSRISTLYYMYREESGDSALPMQLDVPETFKRGKAATAVFSVVSVCVAAIISITVYGFAEGGIIESLTADDIGALVGTHKTEVVAHRCGAHYAPENTVAALRNAAKMDVKWCELDVQMTKDGKLIIIHDYNFKRTTGKDANTWDLTFDEVRQLDAGSFFSSDFKGEKIPTLDEIIKAAKECNVKLQIELKPTGHVDEGLEQAVIDCIEENDFQDQCVVASLNYPCLEKVHKLNKDLRILYMMNLAFGDVLQADAANDFSIESTWINTIIVDRIHSGDGLVSAWTVDSFDEMERVISCDVDFLVTDELEEAQKLVYRDSPGFISETIIDFLGLGSNEQTAA